MFFNFKTFAFINYQSKMLLLYSTGYFVKYQQLHLGKQFKIGY